MEQLQPRKLGLTSIGGVLRNDKEKVLCFFYKGVGVKASNKADVLAILDALIIFSYSFQQRLIVQSDLSNMISRVTCDKTKLWFHNVDFRNVVFPSSCGVP